MIIVFFYRLIYYFFVYIVVDGQVLGVGKEACKQIKCGEDNKLNCNCCVSNDGNQYRCYAKMEFCKEMCGIML